MSTFAALHLCQQSALGIRPMAFPALRAMGQPFDDGKNFDFENVAFSPHDSPRWFLKCILEPRDHITPSAVDVGRCGLEASKWLSRHQI